MNVDLDPVTHVFYSDMYNSCKFNPKVAHFTDVFYTDRGGHGSVKDVGSINIYDNIGTASQPGCYSSQTCTVIQLDISLNSV